jgi:hypothetical protein
MVSEDSSTSGAGSTEGSTLGGSTHASSAEATSTPTTSSTGSMTDDASTTMADSSMTTVGGSTGAGTTSAGTTGVGTSGTGSEPPTTSDATSVDPGGSTGNNGSSDGSSTANTTEATTGTTGSATTGSSTGEVLGSEGTTTVDLDVAPSPGRWVLRDADGVATNAVATPACRGAGPHCMFPDFGTQGPIYPECAHVTWLGNQYVNAPMMLATGSFEDCGWHYPQPWLAGPTLEDDCLGPFYSLPGDGVADSQRFERRLRSLSSDGVTYYESSAVPLFVPDGYYLMTVQMSTCIYIPNSQNYSFSTWAPAPNWMMDAFLNPPYSLSWETL